MTYGEARDRALHLVHQESIAGVHIPGSYNNQQDYLDKIPGLVDAAEMDLATTNRKLPETVFLGDLDRERRHGVFIYTLPSNMWQRRGSGILIPDRFRDSGYRRYNQLKMLGRNQLVLTQELPPDSMLEYFRYPEKLPQNPVDDVELDNDAVAHEAIPFYVAAHLVITDDAFLYATLYNEYTSRKAAMIEPTYTEPGLVEDVYGLGFDADYRGW